MMSEDHDIDNDDDDHDKDNDDLENLCLAVQSFVRSSCCIAKINSLPPWRFYSIVTNFGILVFWSITMKISSAKINSLPPWRCYSIVTNFGQYNTNKDKPTATNESFSKASLT